MGSAHGVDDGGVRTWGRRRWLSTVVVAVGFASAWAVYVFSTNHFESGLHGPRHRGPELTALALVVTGVFVAYTANRGLVPTFVASIPPFLGASALGHLHPISFLVFWMPVVTVGWTAGIALSVLYRKAGRRLW